MAGLNVDGQCCQVVTAPTQPSNWLSEAETGNLTDFQKSILYADWEKTPLGQITQWPQQLRAMVLQIVADPSPAAVCWGNSTKTTTILNEAYTSILDPNSTPTAARSLDLARDWYNIPSVVQKQCKDATTIMMPERLVLLEQRDMLVEAYFTWRFTPIMDSGGVVVGSLVTGIDVTTGMVANRRLKSISSLSHAITAAEDPADLWSRILNVLQNSKEDITAALLYSSKKSSPSLWELPIGEHPDLSTQHSICTLTGTVGDSVKYLKAPAVFHLTDDESWLAASFNNAIETSDLVLLSAEDGTMPGHLTHSTDQKARDSQWSRIVICPLRRSHGGSVYAFLVLALPSWRPYDDDYQSFIRTFVSQIAPNHMGGLASKKEVTIHSEGVEPEDDDKASLALSLHTRTLEVEEGERKLARFTTRAQVALGILNAQGTVVFANPLWRELTQLEPADSQVAWAKAIVAEDLEQTYALFARMVSESAPVDFYLRFNKRWQAPELDRDGNPVFTDTHIICNLFPDLDEDGNVATIMSCLTDISELKWVESQLRQRTADVEHREAMWRNFVDHAPTGLALLNPDGSLEFGNDTWCQMTQSSSTERSGLGWLRKLIHPEDVSRVEEMFSQALDHNAPDSLEFRLKQLADRSPGATTDTTNPVHLTILCTVHTTFHSDGSVQYAVVWMSDVTAQKLSENDLRKRMDHAIRMKMHQEKFIAMTSHELRNPLSAMVHCADEILDVLQKFMISRADNLVEDAIRATDTIIYCAMHQKRIVDDILTLSRLDSDLLVISPQPAVFVKTIGQAMRMFAPELKRARISFDLQEDETSFKKHVLTLFDAGRLLQVFVNLMTNAIKFTRTEERRKIRVEIGASLTKPFTTSQKIKYIPKRETVRDQTSDAAWGNGQIVYHSISVTDTGRGLTEEEMKHLFNVFQQASPRTHVQYGGSGLGLFISRQLVEMHGGEIGVVSVAGQGSTFACYVKARKVDGPTNSSLTVEELPLFMDAETLREASGGGVPNHIADNKMMDNLKVQTKPLDLPSSDILHILVVEDNILNQKVVAKQLQRHGCITSIANHGVEALACVRKSEHWAGVIDGERLSVVLMDLEMPVMDGLTCVREIRQAQMQGRIRGHIPVIATTANARADQVAEAFDAGMDDVVIKPYRIPDIITLAKALLGKLQNSAINQSGSRQPENSGQRK